MSYLELFIIAVGLSMDAFAVSIAKGLSVCRIAPRHSLCVGSWFGGFQALMPLVGFYLGVTFSRFVTSVDHWIAFFLLGFIGMNMIRESFSREEVAPDPDFSVRTMFVMAVATSIDALAVGISFAVLSVDIWSAVAIIGATTFLLSIVGLKIGNIFGCRYKTKAEFFGGAVLLLLGVKILVEHTCI
ncbi:MAG: manganese efflux pump [Bacteroidaceae bacterium]|nr:manganese efflux pump [Bacteroidaceae bacterium]